MLPSQSLYTGTCERSMLVAVLMHDLRQRSYLAPPEDPRNGSSREVGVLDLGIPGPRDLGPSRSGTLEIWGPRDLGPSGSGPWGPVLGSPFEPSELTSGGPVRLCLSLCSAPSGCPSQSRCTARELIRGARDGPDPMRWVQTLPKWVISGSKMGPFRPLRGSDLRQIGIKWVSDPVDLGSKTPGSRDPDPKRYCKTVKT